MQIISIKLKGRNSNIFAILTDKGEYVFHSDIIVKYGLSIGEVEEEKFSIALEESDILIAFNTALTYINSRIKTEKQIKDYLYKKGYHSNVVNPVINKLKDYNLINDKIYAESYINSNPNFSKRKIQQKLQEVGIKQEVVQDNLDEIDDLPSCVKACEKFFKIKPVDKTNVEKLTRRLLGQGYKWETIKKAISKYSNLEDFD